MDVKLRRFADEDVERFARWMDAEHARPYYTPAQDWIDEVEAREGAFSWIRHFVMEVDGTPVGFCQCYPVQMSGEDWGAGVPVEGSYSIDYLVGEPSFLRRGVAKAALLQLVDLVWALPDAQRIIVRPDPENVASRALLRSCGFAYDEGPDLFSLVA